MTEKQFKKINKRLLYCLLLTAYCFLLTTSCGRRGDPVLIEPRKEKTVESNKQEGSQNSEKHETSTDIRKSEQGSVQVNTPDAPAGLIGLYTRTSIVLTWNEVAGQNIKYRVYRSTGDGYIPAGETVTPAYTDRNVEPDKKYYYKVSAVGLNEGPLSKEIQIITEVH
jgi:hypothetical protein